MMELDHQQEPEDPEMVEAVEIQGSLERGLARSLVVVRGLVSKLIRTAAGNPGSRLDISGSNGLK